MIILLISVRFSHEIKKACALIAQASLTNGKESSVIR